MFWTIVAGIVGMAVGTLFSTQIRQGTVLLYTFITKKIKK